MSARQNGVSIEHAEAGVFHHCPDLFPHVRFIAMHRAFWTVGLVIFERTFFKALGNIVKKLTAFRTEAFFAVVLPMTENINHQPDCLNFLFHCWIITFWALQVDFLLVLQYLSLLLLLRHCFIIIIFCWFFSYSHVFNKLDEIFKKRIEDGNIKQSKKGWDQ